jgi:hypothetical protein
LPDNHRELEPPDPIPNSAVKWFIADGSVGFPHVRVGHCQASKLKNPVAFAAGFFLRSRYDHVKNKVYRSIVFSIKTYYLSSTQGIMFVIYQ